MYLGKFEVKTGKLHITDPCYDVGTWCGAYNIPVKKGLWEARTKRACYKDWGSRTKYLEVCHESVRADYLQWEELRYSIGVDSGQCGIFDSGIYPVGEEYEESKNADFLDKSHFYGRCCNATLKTKGEAGIIDKGGVVSSSGFGDGSYVAYAKKKDNKIVAILLYFIN